MLPVRCFTCGTVLGRLEKRYKRALQELHIRAIEADPLGIGFSRKKAVVPGAARPPWARHSKKQKTSVTDETEPEFDFESTQPAVGGILDQLGLVRTCCRMVMITYVDVMAGKLAYDTANALFRSQLDTSNSRIRVHRPIPRDDEPYTYYAPDSPIDYYYGGGEDADVGSVYAGDPNSKTCDSTGAWRGDGFDYEATGTRCVRVGADGVASALPLPLDEQSLAAILRGAFRTFEQPGSSAHSTGDAGVRWDQDMFTRAEGGANNNGASRARMFFDAYPNPESMVHLENNSISSSNTSTDYNDHYGRQATAQFNHSESDPDNDQWTIVDKDNTNKKRKRLETEKCPLPSGSPFACTPSLHSLSDSSSRWDWCDS